MLFNWSEYVPAVKKAFGALGKKHPKMIAAYQALEAAAADGDALDAKTRELIAIAVAITTRAPLGSALLHRHPGDEVEVGIGNARQRYEILDAR